jgi:hypothetical protein
VLHLVAHHCFCIEIEGKKMVFLQNGKHCFTTAICDHTAWLNVSMLPAPEAALCGKAMLSCTLWHCRLCNIGTDPLAQAIKGKVATRLVIESNVPVPCIRGKHNCYPFPKRARHRTTSFLKRVHSDLHQLPVQFMSGFCYWLLIVDDYSRYLWIYLLQRKSDTFDMFKEFKVMIEKQFDKTVLCLNDNKGGEFIGIKWAVFFAQHSMRRKHTVKMLPQQNSIVEHLNCTLEELLIIMPNGTRLLAHFWGEGLNYLRHVIVCSPSSLIPTGMTPREMVHKCKPTAHHCTYMVAAPVRTSSAKNARACRTTPSRVFSQGAQRTSRGGSCGTYLPTAAVAASLSHATLYGMKMSSSRNHMYAPRRVPWKGILEKTCQRTMHVQGWIIASS